MGESISQSEAALISGLAEDSTTDGLDWDNLEEVAPSVEEAPEEPKNEESNTEPSSESEDSDTGDDSESPKEESKQADSEVEEPKSEDSSGEEESSKESPELYEVKVDGKVEEVSLDDLKSNYSGKVAYDKKFSEFDRKEKSFEAEMKSVNDYVEDLGNTMRNVSVLEGVYKIGELNNIGAHQIKQALLAELKEEVYRQEGLDDSQREFEYNQADLKYKQELQERQSAEFEQKQAQTDLQSRIGKEMEALQIDNGEWDDAVSYLDSHLDANEAITPELVSEYVQFNRAESRTENALKSFDDGNYLKDEETFKSLHNVIMDNPDFTDEDISDILADAFGKSKQEVAEVKAEKVAARRQPKQSKNKLPDSNSEYSRIETDEWDDIL